MTLMLRKTFIPVLVSAVLTLALACSQNDGRICDPRCEYAENPIGIDVVPRFTWEYDAPGFVQEGYRITVSSSKERLETPDIWDSGIVKGNDPSAVFPQDTPLESFSRYYWKVTAYGSGGKEIESGVSWFETAMMNQSDWTAEWISDNLGKDAEAAPMFRKSFTAESGLQRAKLYISAVAYSRTRINGKPVSDNMLDPGYTHYDRRNLYSVLDVTDLIDKGENVISAVLGNGFYNEIKPVATWNFENARWRDRAKLICELHLEYKDGKKDVIATDSSWKTTSDGPYISNNIYSGDTYDARKEIKGWELPGFNDSAWDNAEEATAPSGLLKSQIAPAVKISAEISPVSVKSFGDTVHVFDFGKNMSGVCRLSISGERGTEVRLVHGELLKSNGRVEMSNIDIYFNPMPGYDFQTDRYIMSGEGVETWNPEFTYHGFRYVEVRTDRPVAMDESSLTAMFLHTGVESAGEFSSSEELFNTVWEMTRQSYLSNLVSIPTDCPQREKNGWTADAWLSMDLGLLNYDGINFYEKWLDDFVDNQTPEGRISGIIPSAGWGYDDWIGPVWDAAAFIIPYALYCYYGDLRPIEKMWPVCERYLDYLQTREEPDGGVTYGIGDWLSYKDITPTQYSSTCYYYYDNILMARFAGLLGKDGSRYAKKAESLRKLINTKYFDPETAVYSNGTQAALALALSLGIPEGKYAGKVAENLNKAVEDNGGHLNFGTIGSKTVLRMLTRYGYEETAYAMAAKTDCPSWGWWVEQGFTTLAETWALSPQWRDASVNHVFFGDVAAWYVNDIAGINFDEEKPGFSNIIFRPHFLDSLDWAKASYDSVRGKISASWSRTGSEITYTIDVPDNCTAEVLLPGQESTKVQAGRHVFRVGE